jgi:diguanylate cyclase (GGDEF)-like protein
MATHLDAVEEETVVATAVDIATVLAGARDHALLLVLSGPAVGETYTIGAQAAVFGRGDGNEVQIPDPGISRHHARFALTEGGFTISDLASANGTFVNGERIKASTRLSEADRIQLGPNTSMKITLLDPLEAQVQQRLHDAIYTDVLTGMRNRRYLETRLLDEFAHASRHRRPLCLLMLDIDHFKHINDAYGHPVGDIVLRSLAADLMHEVRTEDVVVRYGGEEFLIVSRELTEKQGRDFGERLRAHVQATPVAAPGGAQIPMTISVGIASLRQGRDRDPAALIARADAALYKAKQSGRNRVECDATPRAKARRRPRAARATPARSKLRSK